MKPQSHGELFKPLPQWRAGDPQWVSLVITEECNLRCRYCYMEHKNSGHRMPREIAFRAVDFFLSLPNPKPAVVWDFIGGEPLLEIDLIRQITEYIKARSKKLMHPWRTSYMLQVSTNGVLYDNPVVQQYLWENRGHCGVAITLDGTKRKHDMNRVFKDGSGSYDVVARNFRLFASQNPGCATKVTFSHDDLPYVCESMIHLWGDIGIRDIAANPVFENVWQQGDADIYESQLRELADIIIDEGYWRTCRTNLFVTPPALSLDKSTDDSNWCGTGKMAAIDSRGKIFPCVRFMQYSLTKHPERCSGDIFNGYDENAIRAFYCLRKSLQSPPECMNCDMSHQCAWCSGHNYDVADSDTVFQRAVYLCEMHKARYRASEYLLEQLDKRCGLPREAIAPTFPRHSCPI